MTPNKLPPLPEPDAWLRIFEDDGEPIEEFCSSAKRPENWPIGDCIAIYYGCTLRDHTAEALSQSQSLPAGAVAVRELSLSDYLRIEAERVEDHGLKDRLRKFSNIAEQKQAIPASELRDSFRWNALLNRIDTASAKEFGTLLNIIGDARALGCGCLENYVDQIDVGELR